MSPAIIPRLLISYPLHLQEFAKGLGNKSGDFTVSETYVQEIITIPAHQFITSNFSWNISSKRLGNLVNIKCFSLNRLINIFSW